MVLVAAVLLTAGTVVFTLFVRGRDIPETPPESPTAHLEQRKAQIYENLRDLQFEFRVGKLSDADYQKTKLDLQRELAKVLAEIDSMGPMKAKAAAVPAAKPKPDGKKCPHCGATFPQPLKFCGECGKAMAS
jgi:outer membrane biogenesis lipoprotein LolB